MQSEFDYRCRAACESIWRDSFRWPTTPPLEQYCKVLTPILREYFAQADEENIRLVNACVRLVDAVEAKHFDQVRYEAALDDARASLTKAGL